MANSAKWQRTLAAQIGFGSSNGYGQSSKNVTWHLWASALLIRNNRSDLALIVSSDIIGFNSVSSPPAHLMPAFT